MQTPNQAITTVLICCVMLSMPGLSPGEPAGGRDEEIDPAAAANALCGPRSVRKILGEFGIRETVPRLVEELQPATEARGTSMAALDEALKKRGVFTAPMRVGSHVRIDWKYPVLLHLKEDGDNGEHFAVQLPSTNKDEAHVWMGPGDLQTVPWQSAARHRSGVMLLTSAEPVEDPRSAFHVEYSRWMCKGPLVGLLVVSSVCILFWLKLRRREKLCVTSSCSQA